MTKRVDTAATLETVALYGETKGTSGEALGDLRAIRDDVGGLDVRVASTALVGVGDGMEQLLEYPYGCTEQLTSRLVPLVATRELARDFDVALPKDADALADVAIAKILGNQRPDGGFGWWPDSQGSDPWVTAYALWGLDIAKKAGRPVPMESIERSVAWLRSALHFGSGEALERTRAAFSADVLVTIGRPDPGYVNQIYEGRQGLPFFARALLAHAIAASKMDAKQAAEMLRDIEAHVRLTPTGAVVEENLGDEYAAGALTRSATTTAMALRALVAVDPSTRCWRNCRRGGSSGRAITGNGGRPTKPRGRSWRSMTTGRQWRGTRRTSTGACG